LANEENRQLIAVLLLSGLQERSAFEVNDRASAAAPYAHGKLSINHSDRATFLVKPDNISRL
jgi:hypothetical protein